MGNAPTALKPTANSTVPLQIKVGNWTGGINTWKCGKAEHGERLHREDEPVLTASPSEDEQVGRAARTPSHLPSCTHRVLSSCQDLQSLPYDSL